ncbi:MAG: tetratricopeptide repeat protein, partial [Bacteroidales bacterium]|nr:tetratricopeptide repeat protein [Bacteroidales bacterium]
LDLENQYQQQLEDLENYVDQFARIDLSELNAKQQELIDLVKKGEIDKAIQKYESDDYQGQYRKQCEEIAKIDKAQAQLTVAEAQKRSERDKIYQTINRQIATYRLAGGRENFNKVTALLKSVADADTTQLEAVFAYARHALNQHLDEECEKYFNIYIRACQDKPAYSSSAWWMLGQTYLTQHALKEAEVAFDKALTIRQELAKQEPDRFADALLEVQNSLSDLYLWTGKYDEAYTILQDAIPVCEKLSKEEPQYYLPPLSTLYGNIGITQYAKGDAATALKSIEKALTLARPLYNKTAESEIPLIYALDKMGQIAYMTSDWPKMVESQKELTDLHEELFKQNPEKHINYLQSCYNNLAEAYLHLPDLEACQKALTRSEELLKEMVAKKPEGHYYAAFNLYDIAVHLYAALGNTEKKNFYLDAAKTAFGKMQPEEQEQNKGLMEALQKM